MKSLLITRPRYEPPTHYLYHWASLIVVEARQKRLKVFDLEKEKATRARTESYLRKQAPDIVVFNGHGDDSCVTGQDGEPLIDTQNVVLLKGKIVYARACNAGKTLGAQIIACGGEGFVGYNELFRFYTKRESFNRPLEDDYAAPFFESSNQVAFSLLKGKSAREAHADSLKVYSRIISTLLVSGASNSFVVPDLYWNMYHQVCFE